jgi:hypothetical protein
MEQALPTRVLIGLLVRGEEGADDRQLNGRTQDPAKNSSLGSAAFSLMTFRL